MDTAILVYIIPSLAALIGVCWTIYRGHHTQARQAGRDLLSEMERIIELLKAEIARKDEEMAAMRKENAMLQIRSTTMLQALSAVYRRTPEEIAWRLNNTPPPELRH